MDRTVAKRTGTALGGGIATVLALTTLAPPAVAAAQAGPGRGSLMVCVDGMGGRSFSVELQGPSARTRDVSKLQSCTTFQRIRTGNYLVRIRPLGNDCVVKNDIRRVVVRSDDVRTITFNGGCTDPISRDPNPDPHRGGHSGPNGPDGTGPNGPRGQGGPDGTNGQRGQGGGTDGCPPVGTAPGCPSPGGPGGGTTTPPGAGP